MEHQRRVPSREVSKRCRTHASCAQPRIRAGLLLLDWTTGRALRLTGEARTEFTAGAERRVHFTVTEVRDTPAAVPPRWSASGFSPAHPRPPG
ncbi:hypothetical protein RKD26_004363 [Streptomyces calvus]